MVEMYPPFFSSPGIPDPTELLTSDPADPLRSSSIPLCN